MAKPEYNAETYSIPDLGGDSVSVIVVLVVVGEVVSLHLLEVELKDSGMVQVVVDHVVANVSEIGSRHQCIRHVGLEQSMSKEVQRESQQDSQHWRHHQAKSTWEK